MLLHEVLGNPNIDLVGELNASVPQSDPFSFRFFVVFVEEVANRRSLLQGDVEI